MSSGIDRLPLRPAGWVRMWGRTMVAAPHPDDESLGCGGALALLADAQSAVRVVFT
ncbi:MAG: PIG-L family deacetylase, partial [Catalinimonas sp.]